MPGALPRKQLLPTSAGRLEYILSGGGRPTWLLFNGAGIALEGWRGLYPGIERLGTVFGWNRPGLGRSDRPRVAQTASAVLAPLREMLAHCRLEPPYVLVGHSLGGLHANLFARRYPGEVQGVVMIEATHPRDAGHGLGHESRLVDALARMFPMPKPWFRANLHAELQCQEDSAREVEAAGPFPPVPLAVISGAQTPPRWLADAQAVARRRELQQELARMSPLGQHVLARESGHFPQRTEPGLVLSVLRAMAARLGDQAAVKPL